MVQIIAGDKGKGKTKYLLEQANAKIKDAQGSIVYLDKSAKHMYELNRQIRLINVSEFPVSGSGALLGFISGILSQDHDLEIMFLDSFLKLADLEDETADISAAVKALEQLGEKYNVTFVLSISRDANKLPEDTQKLVTVAL